MQFCSGGYATALYSSQLVLQAFKIPEMFAEPDPLLVVAPSVDAEPLNQRECFGGASVHSAVSGPHSCPKGQVFRAPCYRLMKSQGTGGREEPSCVHLACDAARRKDAEDRLHVAEIEEVGLHLLCDTCAPAHVARV